MKATTQLSELRDSSEQELKTRLGRLQEELFGHRMKRYTNQLANTMSIRSTRREIARIQTILSARVHGVETTAPKTADKVEE